MSHHPARYHQRTPVRRDLPYRAVRQIDQIHADTAVDVAAIRGDGIVDAAELETNAYLTNLTLGLTGMLTNTESQLTSQNPLGAVRYHAIVDAFAAGAVRKLHQRWLEG